MAHITESGIVDDYTVLPTTKERGRNIIDSRALVEWLKPYRGEVVYLEDFQEGTQLAPKTFRSMSESFSSTWTCLALLGMRRKALKATEWQRQYWPASTGTDTKEEALKAAKAIWPEMSFHKSDRCSTPHDGIVDACLIAEFARRETMEGLLPPTEKEEFELNFVRTWNALVTGTGIGGIRGTIPKGRLSQWNQRLKQPEWKENYEEAIKAMVKDDHCLGNNERGWKANLEYFLRPNTLDKLLDRAKVRESKKNQEQQKEDTGTWL